MPDGFLPRTGLVDRVQWERDFDELAGRFDGVVGRHKDELGKLRQASAAFGGEAVFLEAAVGFVGEGSF